MLILANAICPVTIDAIDGPDTPSKRRLIAAGERMLGERGFDGPSLQDIALAAGNANKYAVQYHFGSKAELVRAILALRLRWIDARRRALLEAADPNGLASNISALIEILYLPVAEQIDENGRHSFARFRLQYYTRPDYDRSSDDFHAPIPGSVGEIRRRLMAGSELDQEELDERLHLLGSMLLAALVDRDNRSAHGQAVPPLTDVIARATRIATQALLCD